MLSAREVARPAAWPACAYSNRLTGVLAPRVLKWGKNLYNLVTLRGYRAPGVPEPSRASDVCSKASCTNNLHQESRRSAHGEQAGTKYSGHLSEHGSKGQIPDYDLSGQWRQADGENSVLRQVFRAPGEQQPG